jgi:DsbC/DsbD-like thiol-disulfide interchange protein
MFAAAIRLFPALFATFCVILALAPIGRAGAADASAWDGDPRSATRLIAANAASSQLRAGVEIRLAPGWKTYWRYPGDSGVPPRFDFSGSDNVKAVTVRWPAPQLFSESDGKTIGYHTGVIFPLQVEAQNPSQPVTLRLALDYAVCEKLCVPVEAKAELALTDASSVNEAALAAAERRVPRPSEVGAAGALSIVRVHRDAGSTPPRVLVDIVAPAGAKLAVFAEGPTPDWALPLPEAISGAPAGQQRFVFALDGLPPETKPDGATLRLTAVAADAAIEATYRLD